MKVGEGFVDQQGFSSAENRRAENKQRTRTFTVLGSLLLNYKDKYVAEVWITQ